jgi:putative membrane protein
VRTIRLALLELRRFRGPLPRLVPFGLALIPLLSAGAYLWSAWDPYGQLDRLPVAVVNQDRPVTSRGELIDAGELLVHQLQQDRFFDWRFVTQPQASRGLRDGRYAFTVTVPPDFSARLAGPAGQAPRRAAMLLSFDDGANGYLTGKLAETAQARLQNQADAAARTAFAQRVLGDLDVLRGQLAQVSTAATTQQNRTTQAAKDAATLTQQRRDATQLAGTAQQLTSSAQQAAQATSGATATIAEQIPTAAQAVIDASGTAQRATSQATGGVTTAQQQADLAVSALAGLARDHPDLRGDANLQLATQAARQADRAAATAGVALQEASTSSAQAASSAQQVQRTTSGALPQLRSASTQGTELVRTAQQVADGTNQLRAGLDRTLTGRDSLQAQLAQLQRGATQLAAAVRTAGALIPPANPQQRAQIAESLGAPVDLVSVNRHPAGTYGRGEAPLFFGVALWLFALIAYLVLRPLNARVVAGRARALTIAVAGWLPAAALGIVGVLVLHGVLDGGLGLDPLHPLWTIGLLVLAAAALVAAIHLLRTALGLGGLALALGLLVVQLTASGGLYPLETAPAPFRVAHAVSPLTYLVEGLRVTISGGDAELLIRAAAVLGGILLLCVALTTLVVARRRVWTVERLHLRPAVEL